MPLTDEPIQPRSPRPAVTRTSRQLVMPVVQIGDTALLLSYQVFIAAAAIALIVAASVFRNGNADLGLSAVYACLFWIGGWGIQSIAMLCFNLACGLRQSSQVIGLIGLTTTPRYWNAARTFGHSLLPVICLLAASGFLASVAGVSLASPPALGLNASESVVGTGAWLLLVQGLFQLVPLQKTLGRSLFTSIIALLVRERASNVHALVARRGLVIVSLALVAVALLMISAETVSKFPRWPFVLVLAMLVWISSRSWDLSERFDAYALAELDLAASDMDETFWSRRKRLAQERKRQQALKETLDSERNEAVDASQLDAILEQLHSQGLASLSGNQREILLRVSASLRKYESRSATESADADESA